MIWILPLEPLEERYTEQWYRWFAEYAHDHRIDYSYVDGKELTFTIETGEVLDAEGTNYWKFTQLTEVCELFKRGLITNGDKFFTMDLWHPGLEAIPYMATLEGLEIEIYGFLHAGSYIEGDFTIPMKNWAYHFEEGWFEICKKIFVGSQIHKDIVVQKRKVDPDKIVVTGNPICTSEVLGNRETLPYYERDNKIIFPHRWDYGKRPDIFVSVMNKLWQQRKDFEVIITTGNKELAPVDSEYLYLLDVMQFPYTIHTDLRKDKFYDIIAESKISVLTGFTDLFGYSLIESMILGCIPISNNCCSHIEIVNNDPKFLYLDEEDAVEKISSFLDSKDTISTLEIAKRQEGNMRKIFEEMEV